MTQRKWYRKKRLIFIFLPLLLWIIGQMEFAKLRYDPAQLIQNIEVQTGMKPFFGTKMTAGKTLNYIQVGQRPELPYLLLVHGSPGALNAYEPYLTDTILNRRANLIAVDRPGFGYSDFGNTEPSLAMQAQEIASVLRDLPPTPKILLGHSLGGPVIAKMAMDYPDLVDGLVMVAPSISPKLEPSNTWRKVLDWWPIRWLIPTALRVCNQEIIPLKTELEGMMPIWENLTMPVTVIQGSEDNLVPQGNADFAKKMLTQSTEVKVVKIEGGDHFILWSEIPLIRQEILELLEKK